MAGPLLLNPPHAAAEEAIAAAIVGIIIENPVIGILIGTETGLLVTENRLPVTRHLLLPLLPWFRHQLLLRARSGATLPRPKTEHLPVNHNRVGTGGTDLLGTHPALSTDPPTAVTETEEKEVASSTGTEEAATESSEALVASTLEAPLGTAAEVVAEAAWEDLIGGRISRIPESLPAGRRGCREMSPFLFPSTAAPSVVTRS